MAKLVRLRFLVPTIVGSSPTNAIWFYRLMVRIRPCHGRDTGSTPVRTVGYWAYA